MLTRLVGIFLLLGVGGTVQAESSHVLWEAALERIEGLYLWRDDVEPRDLVQSSAHTLEKRVTWLLVEETEAGVRLSHGDGRFLGAVEAAEWEDLVPAMARIQALLEGAGNLPDIDLEVALLSGLVDGLDRHSRVLYGESLVSFDKRLSGTLSGIGTRISVVDNQLTVREVYPNTPAARGGLKDRDRILAIDGISTVGMDVTDAVGRITGERGTTVVLRVARSRPEGQQELDLPLVRARVKIPNVTWDELQAGFGHIEIDHFSEQTVGNLRRALQELGRMGALDQGLVLDLRGNTGGSMIQAARVADLFVSEGELVSTVGPGGASVRGLVPSINALDDGRDQDVPLVILQDDRTASGSEIVAGALRELDRTILVGQSSYGKGTVQKVYTLRSDLRLKLTVARYLVEGDLGIDEEGLAPDVPVVHVTLGERGVWYEGQVQAEEPIVFVHELPGWAQREVAEEEDMELALALRILEAASAQDARTRRDLLSVAQIVAQQVREEQEARMMTSMRLGGVDWSIQEEHGPVASPQVTADLRLEGEARAGEEAVVRARVENLSGEPLEQVMLRLEAPGTAWHRRWIPLGRVDAGAQATGTATVPIPRWTTSRVAEVQSGLSCRGCPEGLLSASVLEYSGDGRAPVRISLQLVALGAQETDPMPTRAVIQLTNESHSDLEDLRVRFLFPESAGVTLTEYDAGLARLIPGATERVDLGLLVSAETNPVPLQIRVQAAGYGRLATWDVDLAKDGPPRVLSAPRISLLEPRPERPVGSDVLRLHVEDDVRVAYVEVWSSGKKIASVQAAGPGGLDLDVPIQLEAGQNRFVVRAGDDEGLVGRASWVIRGLESLEDLTTDVGEELP